MSGVPADTEDTDGAEVGPDEAVLLLILEARLPLPQMEKSKSSGLKSKPFLSMKFRSSVRDRNLRPSGLTEMFFHEKNNVVQRK